MSVPFNGDLQKEPSNQDSKTDMVEESQNRESNGNADVGAFNAYAASCEYQYGGYNPSVPSWEEQMGFDPRNYYIAGENGSYVYYASGYGYPHQPSYCPLPSATYIPGGQGYGQQGYQYSGPIYQHPDLHYYSSPSFSSEQEALLMGSNKGADGSGPNGNASFANGGINNMPNIGYGLLMPPPPPLPPHVPSTSAPTLSVQEMRGFAESNKGNVGKPSFGTRDHPAIRPSSQSYHSSAKHFQSIPQSPIASAAAIAPDNSSAKRFPPYSRPFFQNNANKRTSNTGNGKAMKPGLGNGEVKLLEKGNNLKEVRSGAEVISTSQAVRPYLTTSEEASQNGQCGPDEKGQVDVIIDRSQYNKDDFQATLEDAKFYIIKSYSEDDVHKSIKYNVWSSTPNGNKKLDKAYQEAQGIAASRGTHCPIFLFFSVNSSGQFCGVAEMVGGVEFNKNMDFWLEGKWTGCFPVKWHVVKDVPNFQLRHIILANNDSKPVTHSRDTQEINLKQGNEMLKIFKDHPLKTSLLDDFAFYDGRQKFFQERKTKQRAYQQNVKLEYRPEVKPAKLNPTEPDPEAGLKECEKLLEVVDLNKSESRASAVVKSADVTSTELNETEEKSRNCATTLDSKSLSPESEKEGTNYKKVLLDISAKKNGSGSGNGNGNGNAVEKSNTTA